MKLRKFLIALMALCLVMSPAMAIGRVIQSADVQPTATPEASVLEKLEMSGCIGMTNDDYLAFKQANPDYTNFPMAYTCEVVNGAGETVKVISELLDRSTMDGQQSDFSIIGFHIGQEMLGIDELMAANGWEMISKWYEGGTLDFTFTKTEGGAMYTLRLWSNVDRNGEIRLIDLKVDDVAAHNANMEAGLNLMPAEFVVE